MPRLLVLAALMAAATPCSAEQCPSFWLVEMHANPDRVALISRHESAQDCLAASFETPWTGGFFMTCLPLDTAAESVLFAQEVQP